jgi:hypothetical protein
MIFFGAGLLALIGSVILLVPNSATTLVAIGCGVGSILLVFAGIRSHRSAADVRNAIEKLRRAVHHLEGVENQRLISSLKSPQMRQIDEKSTPSIVPPEKAGTNPVPSTPS